MSLTAGRFEATHRWTDVEFPDLDSGGTPVIIASITTFNGSNTADLRMRNVRSDGMEAFVEEETSADAETRHVAEAIRYFGASAGKIRDASGSVIGEAGVIEMDQPDREHWHTISLTETYDDPVVFTQIMSFRGSDPCHGRIRNVQSGSFELQIEEWSTYNGSHLEEEIGYIVIEQGNHELADGTPLEVRMVSADHTWTHVNFDPKLGREPAIISRCQTRNGAHEVVTRHRNLDSQGIDVRLQEEEARSGEHVRETIGVLVTPRRDVDIGFGRVEDVTNEWETFEFESRTGESPVVLTTLETFNGRNTAAPRLRNVSPTSAWVRVEEETSQDSETDHVDETISVVTIPSGRHWDKDGALIGEAGRLQTGQPNADHWHSLEFTERYNDPVVFMEIMTFNGEHPSHIRLRNIDTDSCEFQIEEWDYLDGAHTEEMIGYLVLESGTHELADGAHLHVGTTQSDHEWGDGVDFIPDYQDKQPAVLTQCQTWNGSDAVVTRMGNLDANGFNVRLQEEEGANRTHVVETIGFLGVARPGRRVPEYQAVRVLDVRVNNFSVETCGFKFSNSNFSGSYSLPQPIRLPGPIPDIEEVGDASNGMCGGMVFAARDYFEYDRSPWPESLLDDPPANSPVSNDAPEEDSRLFDFLSERLFDSFTPGSGNPLGAGFYYTLMNAPNTPKWHRQTSRNEVMKEQWENRIKPALENGTLCPLGLIHVDTNGQPHRSGLNKIGENHQVLAYGYTKSGNVIDIFVYDPNYVGSDEMRVQFKNKSDLSNWFEPNLVGSSKPLYGFFAASYSPKEPPAY